MVAQNFTSAFIQLTVNQINGTITDSLIKLAVLAGLSIVAFVASKKITNKIGKLIFFLIGMAGAFGALVFTLSAMTLIAQLMPN